MTTPYHLNSLSLQFKLKSPVLVIGSCSSSRTGQSGPSDQPMIPSPPFSSTAVALLPSSRSDLSASRGIATRSDLSTSLDHSLCSRELPKNVDLGNLATTAETGSSCFLPKSLGVGDIQSVSVFREFPGQSIVTAVPSPPRDDSGQFFEDSLVDPIHVHAPGASQVGPQVRQKAPMVPPGFNPLTQGPAGLVSVGRPVLDRGPTMDAALTYTSLGISSGDYHLVARIFTRQVELEEKMKIVEKNHTQLVQSFLNIKHYAVHDKLEKLEEKTAMVTEYLNGRINALQSRNDEREVIFTQLASTSQQNKNNLAARAKVLRDEINKRNERKAKKKATEKKVIKYLSFGGLVVASVGAAYLYLKK